ncbi:GntR family transcriptional regulator [Sphingobium cupriresistens]|uniref:GntR family transcriptional regulator n=1 Tax=Sphingobium cupriresistens LL01 TaxID=1420583 RepID=A0A0J7Y440_9SPHN|nr:GntR family transcriptional regulator [Sphingobium cupriresistens]KMS58599.1 GntR family transcriptional regulator [Sphingobium cupriresistens LL01]
MADESKPVYLRLREIIAASILDGEFSDGDLLPSVRAFAATQGANPLTVAKAYQSFQDDGLVVVKRGVGMFVADGATRRLREAERERFLDSVWPPVAAQIKRLGIRLDDLDLATA